MKVRSMLLAIAVFALSSAGTPTLASTSDMLVSTSWLKEHLTDPKLVIFHTGPKAEFDAGHVPGAQLVSGQDLSIPRAENALILELLPEAPLRQKLESLGISDDSRVVIVFGKDAAAQAARVYFSLDAAGLGGRASLLDGGAAAWTAGGGALTDDVKTLPTGKITASPRRDILVDLKEIQSHLKQPGPPIVDARTADIYSGDNRGPTPRAGHIPGAINVPSTSLLTADGMLKSEGDLAAIFKRTGVGEDGSLVTYCHSGQLASLVYFAAKRVGLKPRLYDGSWDEWSRKEELPVETTPLK
ncbi:MAG: rhodanese-like domain-containing protein [Vicinamibacteria bacterium]